jgi:hypothetical protein
MHEIAKTHAGFGEAQADGLEAEDRLLFNTLRDAIIRRDAELARAEEQSRSRLDFDRVAAIGERLADSRRDKMTQHRVHSGSSRLCAMTWRSASEARRQ